MLIKSIHLKNIRSYIDQKISFNEGITVLSGDIGAGKSSILLALEFCLFGLTTNEAGSGLLRKGSQEGSVEVTINVENKEITLQRTLKRKTEGIRQQNGSIITDGTKKELTPVEMKQAILTMLGYPSENAAKKSQIYHYTTYTPQDEIKNIMFDDADERVNAIRKLFGIDKYQRIIDNAQIISRNLREQKRELQGIASDLENKKEFLKKIQEDKLQHEEKQKAMQNNLQSAKHIVEESKKKVIASEGSLKQSNELKKEKLVLEANSKNKKEQSFLLEKEIKRFEEELISLKEKINPDKIEILKQKLNQELKKEITNVENLLMQKQKFIGEHEANKKQAEKLQQQMSSLIDCPLCLQKVSHEHKTGINSIQEKTINEALQNLQLIQTEMNLLKESLGEKKKQQEVHSNSEKELSLINIYIKQSTEKEMSINAKKDLLNKLNEEIELLKQKQLSITIPDTTMQEKEYALSKQSLERSQLNEKQIELELTKITSLISFNQKSESQLQEEVLKKENAKKSLETISKRENWLEKEFSEIISAMERHVMSSVYFSLNDNFKDLFGTFIADERLSTRINETFTPVIEQNGHETEFGALSGGEKTSVALSYRLALYQAINAMMSNIKTKGLLILDEPTDGFSSEQIDVLKEVFEKLNTKQAIIVSHESKLESVADNIIRVVKNNHESSFLI